MKKKMLLRGLFGVPVGIAIGFVITLIVSACIGNGAFYPVAPGLIRRTGDELHGVILQTVLCAMMGAGFSGASVIWELDAWSLAKQTGVYLVIACMLMFPISYFAGWMPHSVAGILSYVGVFAAIFAFTWLGQYAMWKRRVKRMNEGISDLGGRK